MLSVLVLFLMIGTAFIITAKQSQIASRSQNVAALAASDRGAQGDLLNEVLLQIVRDTDNPHSVLRFHSLLADMYGHDGFRAVVQNMQWAKSLADPDADPSTGVPMGVGANVPGGVTQGQMVQFDVRAPQVQTLYATPLQLSGLDGAYNGQVVTFLSRGGRATAQGVSTRVVNYRPLPGGGGQFTVLAFPLADGSPISSAVGGPAGLNDSQILINGRPFNGTGVGYNTEMIGQPPTAPRLNLAERVRGEDHELALLPVAPFFDFSQITAPGGTPNPELLLPAPLRQYVATITNATQRYNEALRLAGVVGFSGYGGADESYDAADFQNFLLAITHDTPEDRQRPGNSLEDLALPSLHRPELINYWRARLASSSTPLAINPTMLRKIMARPSWFDHPKFTGSNPELTPLVTAFRLALENAGGDVTDANVQLASERLLDAQQSFNVVIGPWDVDNDGDGARDSVWVDFGAAPIRGPNGKLVKPLAAILLVDLDGRINVNTAGTLDMAGVIGGIPSRDALPGRGNVQSNDTPRGMGWGPAEISIEAALGRQSFEQLFRGRAAGGGPSRSFPGRYGYDGAPGRAGMLDLMAQVSLFDWPSWGVQRGTAFATPPDLRARYGNAINHFGQPVIEATMASERPAGIGVSAAGVNDGRLTPDSPYEAAVFPDGVDTDNGLYAIDAPFSLGELERVLRAYDSDAVSLPVRLAALGGGQNPSERNRITTESWTVPGPLVALPPEMETMLAQDPAQRRLPQSTAELMEIRIRRVKGYAPFPTPLGDPTNQSSEAFEVRRILRQILAPELASGMRLNVNRPLGNGRDDSNPGDPGFGVVDEPGEERIAIQNFLWRQRNDPAAATVPTEAINNWYANSTFRPLDVNDDGMIDDVDAQLQGALLARHLYVMALTLSAPENYGANLQNDRALAERIAQWAVNVVDFRDPDAIMTGFEYDINPFDGWDVNGLIGDKSLGADGILGTGDDQNAAQADDNQNYRGVVWGAERPELVMTEAFAMHDRNTTDEVNEDPQGQDEAADSSDPLNEPNGEFDQLFRPRGSFFLEFYNPWPASPTVSAELHRLWGGVNDGGVDLARTHNRNSDGSPVWRLMIYRNVDPNRDPDADTPNDRPGQADRSVYFTTQDPGYPDGGVAFFRDANLPAPSVRPGRYLVVGSGVEDPARPGVYTSILGRRRDEQPQNPGARPLHRIELDTNVGVTPTIRLVGANDVTAVYRDPLLPNATPFAMESPGEGRVPELQRLQGDMSNSIADVMIIDRVSDGAGGSIRRRLTLSEPARGYPTIVGNVAFVPMTAQGVPQSVRDPYEEGYYALGRGPGQGGNPSQPKAIDVPLDDDPVTGDPQLATLGVKYPYRRIFLQRLANPTQPYDPVANPYRTVDSTYSNLTVFNGRNNGERPDANGQFAMQNSDAQLGFSSVQRGQIQWQRDNQRESDYNVWAVELPDLPGQNPVGTIELPGGGRQAASRSPNAVRSGMTGDGRHFFNVLPRLTLGFLNAPFMDATDPDSNLTPRKRTVPNDPFPWLTWNNRPFVSGNELMLAPRVRSSRLLSSFSMIDDDNRDPYENPTIDQPVQPQNRNLESQRTPLVHLENFFYSQPAGGGGGGQQAGQPSHLYRLLEYVETPSLYAGATTWLNPQMFAPAVPLNDVTDPRWTIQPPFNVTATFREPGRINLNTVVSPAVYAGIFHDDEDDAGNVEPDANGRVHPGPEWTNDDDSLVRSRRGYGGGNDDILSFNDNWPTFFANPFRAPDAGNLVPLASMVRHGVECTLLRSTSASPGQLDDDPLFAGDTDQDYNHAERNAFFRYAPMMRLDNLVTNRSNVYAVWITIGFFEVEELTDNNLTARAVFKHFGNGSGTLADARTDPLFAAAYPDGYMLGKEAGLDEGNVQRLRGFYVIDRSRPVAFEPGKDHNVDGVIRLRRRIE